MDSFDKSQIIAMAKHVFKRGSGVPDKRLMHPRREWGVGILLFAVILIVGSILSANAFSRFRNIDTDNGQASLTIPNYRSNLVFEALEEYRGKKESYQALISDTSYVPPVVTDVSTTTEEVASSTEETLVE